MAESSGGILTVRNKGGVGSGRSLGQHPGLSAGLRPSAPGRVGELAASRSEAGWHAPERPGRSRGSGPLGGRRWRDGGRACAPGESRAAARPGRAQLWLPVRQQRGAVRLAAGSSPVLRPVPIGPFTSPQGHNSGVGPIRQHGDGSRGSLGSSPSQMQRRLPPRRCRPWRWSRRRVSPGAGAGSEALVTPGALRSCCSPWPAASGVCAPPLPGQAAAPSCSPPALMAVTARLQDRRVALGSPGLAQRTMPVLWQAAQWPVLAAGMSKVLFPQRTACTACSTGV